MNYFQIHNKMICNSISYRTNALFSLRVLCIKRNKTGEIQTNPAGYTKAEAEPSITHPHPTLDLHSPTVQTRHLKESLAHRSLEEKEAGPENLHREYPQAQKAAGELWPVVCPARKSPPNSSSSGGKAEESNWEQVEQWRNWGGVKPSPPDPWLGPIHAN